MYTPLGDRGLSKVSGDLSCQLARGDQLELRIAALFASAVLAPNSALICFAQLLIGAIRGVHATDARRPEDEEINLEGIMIGASSNAGTTQECGRDEYPGREGRCWLKNLAKSKWVAAASFASLLQGQRREQNA